MCSFWCGVLYFFWLSVAFYSHETLIGELVQPDITLILGISQDFWPRNFSTSGSNPSAASKSKLQDWDWRLMVKMQFKGRRRTHLVKQHWKSGQQEQNPRTGYMASLPLTAVWWLWMASHQFVNMGIAAQSPTTAQTLTSHILLGNV